MEKYLVEASRKAGLFEPYEPRKHYIVSQEMLSRMLLQSDSWAVWSAKWINPVLTPMEQLEGIYREIEIIE